MKVKLAMITCPIPVLGLLVHILKKSTSAPFDHNSIAFVKLRNSNFTCALCEHFHKGIHSTKMKFIL
jgi:hypothetical protein